MTKVSRRQLTLKAASFMLLSFALVPAPVRAQSVKTGLIRVVDDRGEPVPHAVVVAGGSTPRVTNDSGVTNIGTPRAKKIDFWVRRIGYAEYRGEVRADSVSGAFLITLKPLARTLGAVVVEERPATPLSRTGFYDRVDRVQRGALVGEFITPEELDARKPMNASAALRGRRYARVIYVGSGRMPVVLGRGGCVMTLILDGVRLNNTVQEVLEEEGPTSIDNLGRAQRSAEERHELLMQRSSLDDIVSGTEVSAIEIYSSMATAPSELVQLTGGGSCGIVAIWSGPRG